MPETAERVEVLRSRTRSGRRRAGFCRVMGPARGALKSSVSALLFSDRTLPQEGETWLVAEVGETRLRERPRRSSFDVQRDHELVAVGRRQRRRLLRGLTTGLCRAGA